MIFLEQLALGVIATLSVATFVGRLIRRRYPSGESRAVIDNVNARIGSWWVIVGLVGIAAWLGPIGLALMFGATSLQALREFMPALSSRTAPAWCLLVAALCAQYVLVARGATGPFVTMLPAVASCLALVSAAGVASPANWRAAAGGALLGVYCPSHIPAIATLNLPTAAGSAVAPAIFLVIVVQASDVLQYLAGKAAGRRALAPRLSPSKTLEGALGGLTGATALGAVLAPLTPYGAADAAATAGGLAMLGIAGGLISSALKRRRGIKDWSEAIPGHGGVLDRLDSLWLSAPAFYHLLRMTQGA